MSTRSELLDLEHRFWSATGDPDFWRERFADDGVVVLEMGMMDKATVMSTQEDAAPWIECSIEDARVLRLGDDAASIAYRVTARRRDEDAYSAVASSSYARHDGTWQLVVHQQTPVR
jgi:hypothetical protein